MKKILKTLTAAALLTATLVTASASDTPTRAIREMDKLPTGWSPLEISSEARFLQDLTGGGLKISSGMVTDFQDVTAEYAGNEIYGVPENATRGYAYRITLNEDACWDDNTAINADTWIGSARKLLDGGADDLLILANAKGYRENGTRSGIISLMEAGYDSVAAAQEAGVTEFFLDLEHYWGLGQGWYPLGDITRFRDRAITQGCREMYVSPAWLYRQYLADEQPYAYFQSEFVGIPMEGAALSWGDVGLVKTGDHELTIILEEPMAASYLASRLENFRLIRNDRDYREPESGASYGPYVVVEVTTEGILLERNPAWWGQPGKYDQILCR